MKTPFDQENISDELLNAFIDNELDDVEHQQLMDALLQDPSLNLRVCELRQIKELVASARPKIDHREHISQASSLTGNQFKSIAASVVLLVSGFFITSFLFPSWFVVNETQTNQPELSIQNATHLVFHVNKNNAKAFDKILITIAQLLEKSKNKNLQIEVITSGPGLYLLDPLASHNANLIRHLYTHYKNINFIVCQKTLKPFRAKTNRLKQIPDEMMLTASAPELIKLRRQQGWFYQSI